jgi:hypothetical protein
MGIIYPVAHLPMLGKGSLLVDVFDAQGNLTGYQHFGNVTKLEQEIKDDKAKLYQKINRTPTMIAQALKQRDVMLSITGTDFASDRMAIHMMSSGKTQLVTGVTPVVAEALASATVTKHGKYFATIGRNISAVAVKQGGVALVANTDYVVEDPVQGIIYFPLTSAVVDNTAVTVDYTPINATYDQVAGGVLPFVKAKLRFAPDPTDGQKIGVEWWKVNLSPNGKLGLITDDYGNWELEAEVLDDSANHPTDPYFLATFY